MKTPWKIISAVSLALVLGACSSSVKNNEGTDVTAPAPDAGTDAVPQPAIEGQPAPTDPNAPPVPPAEPSATTPPPADSSAAATPPVAAPVASAPEDYSIQTGDTLMKIAFENYGDLYKWKEIYENNKDKIPNPNALVAGTVLKLDKTVSPISIDRNGEKYLIKKGDTLGTISDDVYGTKTKWKKIWENNKQLIKNPNRIFAGFTLYYSMTPEDQQEKDRFKGVAPAPLAQGVPSSTDSSRLPSSTAGTADAGSTAGNTAPSASVPAPAMDNASAPAAPAAPAAQ